MFFHVKSLVNVAALLHLCILEQFFSIECLRSMGQVLSVVEFELIVLCMSIYC